MSGRYRFIAVEGPIGAGKTSLARRLSDYLGASLLLEDVSDNPFLPRFYQDPKRHALATQLHFLFDRAHQLRDLFRLDTLRGTLVADFLLDKDRIFARLNLDDDEFRLYQKIYDDLNLQAPAPDLVIYLQARPDTLLDRVRKRGIAYERPMNAQYLTDLAEIYSRFFNQYEAAPVLIVNSETLNFATRDDDFHLLLERIESMRGSREFFSRAT
jgi:deoxyadenosine/deoxycytidine kinase